MTVRRAAALLAVLMLTVVPASGSRAMGDEGCGSLLNTVSVQTLSATARPVKRTYRVGEIARFAVTVTRPGDDDPVGAGVPWSSPVRQPAPDVRVALGLTVKDVYLWGTGLTNAEGRATVGVKLARYTPAGRGDADGLAMKTHADTPCLVITEIGFFSKRRAIRVVR